MAKLALAQDESCVLHLLCRPIAIVCPWSGDNVSSPRSLITADAVLPRINPKPDNRGYFDRFIPAKCGTELPLGQCRQNFRGGLGRTGFQHSQVLQNSGAVKGAGEHDVRWSKAIGKVFT